MTTVPEFQAAAARQPPLRAPYNFAPLNATVLETPWAAAPWNGEPDHGKPHPEGLSGELVVDWTVETPLLVGGADNNMPFQLGAGGPYAIPGASLRGMIRAVLEVLSYAHFEPYDEDQRFSIRDYDAVTWQGINNATDGRPKLINLPDGRIKTVYLPFGGWLKKDGDSYRLTRCDMVDIEIADLVAAINGTSSRAPLTVDDWNGMSLHARHQRLMRAGLGGVIDLGRVVVGLAGRHGTLVVAGLIKDAANATKEKEVAFLDPPTHDTWILSKAAVEAFAAVQVRDKNDPPEENWSFWEMRLHGRVNPTAPAGRLPLQRIPVFYRGDPTSARQRMPAPTDFVMALTKLMRFPHRFTTREVVQKTQGELDRDRLDFVQALFGSVPRKDIDPGPRRRRPWRSRVRFGLALPKDSGRTPTPLPARTAVTMKPRASFYPFYLRPRPTTNGETVRHPVDWSSDDARLAGRKRYPPRNTARETLPQAPNENPEQQNELRFLAAAPDNPLVFRSTIRFHNLLPEELGGLVWAIGLRRPGSGENRRLRHMLGRAKAFGYGQVKAEIAESDVGTRVERNAGGDAASLAEYAEAFEAWLTSGPAGSGIDFTALPEVAAFLALCDADLGAAVGDALAFPQHGTDTEEAKRVLAAYSTIKKRSACRRSDDDPRRQGGNTVSLDQTTADAFLFLPDYPLEP